MIQNKTWINMGMIAITMLASFSNVHAQEAKTVKASTDKSVNYSKGMAGQSAVMNGKSKIIFPIEYLKTNAGTIEVWVKSTPTVDAFQYLISAGFYNTQFYSAGYDAKGISFLNLKRNTEALLTEQRTKNKFAYYANLKTKTEVPCTGDWVHLAFVWATIKPGACLLQTYINGKLIEDRYNTTIGTEWLQNLKTFGIGFSTSSPGQQGFKGELDELRISNYPKTPVEIKAAFGTVSSGKKLTAEKGTLLLLNFEDTTNAQSSTKEQLDKTQITESFNKIMKELK